MEALFGTIKNRNIELESSSDLKLKNAYLRLSKSTDEDSLVRNLISEFNTCEPHVKQNLREYLFRHIDPANRMFIEQQVNVPSELPAHEE